MAHLSCSDNGAGRLGLCFAFIAATIALCLRCLANAFSMAGLGLVGGLVGGLGRMAWRRGPPWRQQQVRQASTTAQAKKGYR